MSNLRKETMFTRHVTYERQCLMCKIGTGTLFGGLGAFNILRLSGGIWGHMRPTDKLFNIGTLGVIFALSGFSFYKAYEIHMGRTMELVELRPSIT